MNEQTTLQKALYTIKKLKYLLQEEQKKAFEPIAIIGLSCRFPNAVGKEGYWQMLKEGRNIISKMPEKRWELLKGTDELNLRDTGHPYYGGFLSNISEFDAYFFGISPREAIRMDPQHRLLLEVAYEAIEDAGIPLESLAGSKTGVFSSLYVSQLAHLQKMDNEMDALYLPTGNAMSIAANRISYLFDLRGPSIVIDSACSSSMTSLNLACLNLQNKACNIALVCGAKLNLLPYINYVLTKAKMLSPQGQCKTFDADANGYVQGEGVGVIVLKPLTKALQDKDRIYAVINGSAINQDGRTNGLTAPNGLQQETLLKTAYQAADIDPLNISYVECHGTGTFLGDPIEVQALGEIVGKKREKQKPCWIGSVKTNIGHLEPAAGIASLIKVALALNHRQIPPHLNFSQPNPHIAFDKYNLRIPIKLQEWPKYGDFRVAGLSGFGFGGTNAHVVMRELSEDEKSISVNMAHENPLELFTLSAKNSLALTTLIASWCDHLEKNSSLLLSQICYATHVRRSHYNHRLAIIASTTLELFESLKLLKENLNAKKENVFVSDEHNKPNSKQTCEDFSGIDLKKLAQMYVNNAHINWIKFEEHRSYTHIDMPLYPWQHKEYWPPLGTKAKVEVNDQAHPLQGRELSSPLPLLQYEFNVSTELLPDLKDTYNILHAGYYLEIMAFAMQKISALGSFIVEDHKFLSPILAPNNSKMTVQLVLEPTQPEGYLFHFYSREVNHKEWIKNATGKLIPKTEFTKTVEPIETIKNRCLGNETAEVLYQRVVAMGMPAGESIRWTNQYWLGDNEILCEFVQPTPRADNTKYTLKVHPGIFDACIQPLFRLLPNELNKPYIASGAKKLHFLGMQEGALYLWGVLKNIEATGEKIWGNCCLINENSQVIAYLENICLTQLDNRIQIDQILKDKSQSSVDLSSLSLSERKQYIINFLVEQVAAVFSLPTEDINLNTSLRDLGIDSLMALVLMRAIEVGLEKNYSLQDLLEGPTLHELANFLADDNQIEIDSKNANRWISYRNPQIDAKVRLFCFPYGGGGASIYRDWQEQLGHNIEVCPIQLPGREERMDEQPLSDLNSVLEALIKNLEGELNLPFAFFGHSFGSLIAFELARTLRQRNMRLPSQLFVSAFPDPRVPTKSLDKLLNQLDRININLTDIEKSSSIERLTSEQLRELAAIFNENGIMGYGSYLEEKEIMKVLLPIFIGDMGIVKSYQYYHALPLDLPITVFVGKQDTWVSYQDHLEWKDHTRKTCEIIEFEAGHMFIKENQFKVQVLSKIISNLTQKV